MMPNFQWKLIVDGEEVTIDAVEVKSSGSAWSPDGEHWYEGLPPTQETADWPRFVPDDELKSLHHAAAVLAYIDRAPEFTALANKLWAEFSRR